MFGVVTSIDPAKKTIDINAVDGSQDFFKDWLSPVRRSILIRPSARTPPPRMDSPRSVTTRPFFIPVEKT